MYLFRSLFLIVLLVVSVSAVAQENAEPENADKYLMNQGSISPQQSPEKIVEKVQADAKVETEKKVEDSPDMLAKKIELAKKMHSIRSTKEQIDGAIAQVSMTMPEEQRAAFVSGMKSVLNYNAIEKISIDAMVETFTLAELDAMVEYNSKPEALSISKKMSDWAKIVQPEVIRMIDAAIMRVKTGAAPSAP